MTINSINELRDWFETNVVDGEADSLVGQIVGGKLFDECVKESQSMKKRFPEFDAPFGMCEEWYMGEGESFSIDESGKILESFEYC